MFGLLSTDKVADLILASLESRYERKDPADIQNADAIIVAGGMMNPVSTRSANWPEFTDGVDRMLYAVDLWKAGFSENLIFSGGSGLITQSGAPEAFILQRYLAKRDVSALAESRSRNTAENARYSKEICEEYGWNRIVLVTSAFHMPRAAAVFRKAGFEVIPYPVDYRASAIPMGPEAYFPSAHALMKVSVGVKEYIGIAVYSLRGYM